MPTILGANTLSSGYDVANSLRFNGDNFLQRNNPSSNSTDGTKGTFSFWVKRDKFPNESQVLVHQADSSTKRFALQIANNDEFIFSIRNDAESVDIDGTTTLDSVYRDVAAWYHFLFNYDTSGGTNGCKLFVNGAEQALSYSATLPQNFVMTVNTNGFNNHTIGRDSTQSSNFWTGYMTEVMFVDGQQLAPTQFGEYDEDTPTVWKPKDISGINVGNLGYYLDFEDASNLGNDVKGVGDFSETNCATTDQTTDTCTNNFITLNPLVQNTNRTSAQTTSEGNTISIPNSHDSYQTIASTIGLQGAGKWYWEAQVVWNGTSSNAYYPRTLGFVTEDYAYSASYLNQDEESWAIIYQASGGPGWRFGHANSESNISGATSMANGDIMMMALDLDNGKFYAGRNGTFFTSGDPTSGSTGTGALATLDANDLKKFIFPAVTNASNATYYKFNFGNAPYSISSGNSDTNGFGNFEYSVPSGYYAICTKNLGEVG